MNTTGARVLVTDMAQGRIFEEYVDPTGPGALPGMDETVAAMKETLPPVIRRTPRERYQATLQPLVEQALESYRMTGQAQWPTSAVKVLKELAVDDPTLLQNGGVEQVIRQGTALARHIVETGEMQQKAQDLKKVTLDWSGH